MGRNKSELIKLAEKITGQECKDVLTKKDALKKIACYYLGEEKEFASIADCLESIVEHGASGGGSGGSSSDYGKLITLDIKAVPIEAPDTLAITHYNVVVDFSKYPDKYIQLPFNNAYLYPIEQYERVLKSDYLDKDGNIVKNGYDVYDNNKSGQFASFNYLPTDKSVTKIVSYIENNSDKSLKLYEINVSYPE